MKKIIITSLFIVVAITVKSQDLRHSKGNQGLDFSYSYTKAGGAWSAGYVNYLKDNMILKVKFNYENGSIDDLKLKTYMLMPAFNYTFPVLPPVFFINLEGGAMVGKESISNENFLEEKDFVIYGITYGLEAEIYLNSNIAFILNYQQIYAMGSDLSPHRFQIGGGIRLILK